MMLHCLPVKHSAISPCSRVSRATNLSLSCPDFDIVYPRPMMMSVHFSSKALVERPAYAKVSSQQQQRIGTVTAGINMYRLQ